MSGNRHNGGIIGPKNITSSVRASGVWDITAARQVVPWPSTDLPTDSLLANWDFSNAISLFDATTGGSNVAADGAIARVEDQSGNGWHLTQSTINSRPLRKTEIINQLDAGYWDGVDDGLSYNLFSGSLIHIICVYSIVDTTFIQFAGSAGGNDFTFVATQNNSSTSIASIAGLSARVDGSLFTGTTRGDVYNALVGTHCISYTGDFDAWSQLFVGNYGGAFNVQGYFGEILIYDQAAGVTVRDTAEAYLMDKWGIS